MRSLVLCSVRNPDEMMKNAIVSNEASCINEWLVSSAMRQGWEVWNASGVAPWGIKEGVLLWTHLQEWELWELVVML